MSRITRRIFLKQSAAAGSLALAGPTVLQAAGKGSGDSLKGFIVGDDHFGWKHPVQPPSEVIAEAIQRIIRRFPDLDMFLDAGDVHHGSADDAARGEWLDIVPGGCGPIPFFLAPGNHDLSMWGQECDVEWRCARFGNFPARPYYSFDLKGVHFAVVPQLTYMSYVTRETLEWIKLDLALNKDKTTILLAHNSIKGTTEHHDDPGYRRLANSEEVLDLIKQYPNVVGWMHGHNHTWEVVKKFDKLFISVGRIGGFDPPFSGSYGKGHIGGIYFEVGPDHFTARSYSATKQRFFDEMGFDIMTKTLPLKTSFDAQAPACFSYGAGNALDGQRLAVSHHYAGSESRELFIAGAHGPVINENPDFSIFSHRTNPYAPDREHVPGFVFVPHDDIRWQWMNPGVLIRASDEVEVGEPTTLVCPGPGRGKKSYFRCPPGKKYRLTINLESPTGGQHMQVRCKIHNRQLEHVATIEGPAWNLLPGKQTKHADFELPDLADQISIYTDRASDNTFNVMFEAEFSNMVGDVLVKRFAITFADAYGVTENPVVCVDGDKHQHRGDLGPGEFARFDLPTQPAARSVYEVSAGENRRLTWLIRQTGIAWQVRNAVVAQKKDHLAIGPLRNTFSSREEVVIVPMAKINVPFVHRLRHVNVARVYPLAKDGKQLKVEVLEVLKPAEIEILSDVKPTEVTGVDFWRRIGRRVLLSVRKPTTAVVQF